MQIEHIGSSRPLTRYPAHCHEHWELIANHKGRGIMTIDGVQYTFRPGTVVLCPPGVLHEKNAPEGFEDRYIQVSGWELPHRVRVWEDDRDGRISKLTQILAITWHEPNTGAICADLLQALTGLMRPVLADHPLDKNVVLLRHRIIAGFHDAQFSLEAVQQDIPISRDHLRRLFRKEHGVSPHEYLTQLRLNNACRLLAEGVPVNEAAYRSGFYDALYFSRVFRKYKGICPSKWK